MLPASLTLISSQSLEEKSVDLILDPHLHHLLYSVALSTIGLSDPQSSLSEAKPSPPRPAVRFDSIRAVLTASQTLGSLA